MFYTHNIISCFTIIASDFITNINLFYSFVSKPRISPEVLELYDTYCSDCLRADGACLSCILRVLQMPWQSKEYRLFLLHNSDAYALSGNTRSELYSFRDTWNSQHEMGYFSTRYIYSLVGFYIDKKYEARTSRFN